MSMPNYLYSICPHCGRTLRIRSAYIGRMVTCNHCDHPFLAEEMPANRSAGSSGESAATGWPATRPSEPCETGPRTEVEQLQVQLEAFRQRIEWAESVQDELESSRKENGRLATTIQVLKTELLERVTEVDRLQRSADDLLTVRAQRDQSDQDLQAAREAAKALGTQLSDTLRAYHELKAGHEQELHDSLEEASRQRELESLSAQAREQQIVDELHSARRQLEEESKSFASRIDTLERALATVRTERDDALVEARRLQAAVDGSAERESQWQRSFEESENRHRSAIDELSQELQTAGTHAALAEERERALAEQRQSALQELDGMRTERDRLAAERVEAELALRLIGDQSRDQRDSLLCELQEARRWEEIAVERETELLDQIQALRRAYDLSEQKIEDQRRELQEESAAMARDLEARLRQQMADEGPGRGALQEQIDALHAELEQRRHRADDVRNEVVESSEAPARGLDTGSELHAAEDSARLLDSVSSLQEQVEILQQQRDDAMEQAGMIRLDRDRLYGSLARLEARVQEADAAILQRAAEADDHQRALDAAHRREFRLRAQLDSLANPGEARIEDHAALERSPVAESGKQHNMNEPALVADPIAHGRDGVESPGELELTPLVADRRENADPTPSELVADSPIEAEPESDLTPELELFGRPRPLAAESPEARILHLRNSLRMAHEARGKGPFGGPLFSRLARLWNRSGSLRD